MGRRRMPGLVKLGKVWHIDKKIKGYGRLCESTGHSSLLEAEEYLRRKIESIKKSQERGRPLVFWEKVAIKYLLENKNKASIKDQSYHLEDLHPFIGKLYLEQVHDDSLKAFVAHRRSQGIRTKSINLALEIVRHILNLCANSWRHPDGVTWLEHAPKISMQKPPLGKSDARKPYPLDWDEQRKMFALLPGHLAEMALFKVNTGNREKEVCGLRWEWEWETDLPDLKGRIFIIPGDAKLVGNTGVKNREDRLIVLNDIAKSVIEQRRGIHNVYVFTYKGRPMARMNNTAWKRAWKKAELPVNNKYLRGVHNLKHTFGRRLRAAGVMIETRKVLLGHTNGDITTEYSAPEITELLYAVNKLCRSTTRKSPELAIVRLKVIGN